jgi:hypothetical protein
MSTVDGPAHRPEPLTGRGRRIAGVLALAVAVAATAVLVPRLVSSWSGGPQAGPAPLAPTTASPSAGATSSMAATPPGPAAPATGSATASPSASRAPAPTRPAAPSASFATIRIAAADPANERYDVAVTPCPTCASGSRVQYLGQGHSLVVHLQVPVSGRRTLTIVFESGTPRTLYVGVNDAVPLVLNLPGNDSWSTPQRVSVPVDLPAGESVVRFFNATDPAPDLDQIVLS